MPKNKVIERFNKLTEIIGSARDKYFNQDYSEISDQEYDQLIIEYKELLKSNSFIKLENDLTQQIGALPRSKFKKTQHRVPMYSLSNGFTNDDILGFLKQVRSFLDLPESESLEIIFEPKIDGLSLALTYENGILVQALTRGDGIIGEDVINNAKLIPDIPNEISCDLKLLEVRGEVYLPNSNFRELNNEQEKNGAKIFSNPRNAASGTIRQFKTDVERNEKLCFFAYSIGLSLSELSLTQSELLSNLKTLGFKTNSLSRVFSVPSDLFVYYDKVFEERALLDYDIDGIVYKINDLTFQQRLGFRSSSPRWAIAHKFPSELSITKINDIDIQIGRTGALSPVAKLQPVNIGGVIVSSATLHNRDFIRGFNNKGKSIREGNDIRIGDWVTVYRAGDVIPKIEGVDISKREKKSSPFLFPNVCPSCGRKVIVEKNDSTVRCSAFQDCEAQIISQLKHFVSKKALNIEGLGEKIIEEFFERKLVKEPADFFTLRLKLFDKIQINKLLGKGWGEKSIENLLASIEGKRFVRLDKLIFSLGIRHIGETVSSLLAKFYESWDEFENAVFNYDKENIHSNSLNEIEGIGPLMVKSLNQYFQNKKIEKKLRNLLQQIKIENVIAQPHVKTAVTDIKLLFTGTFNRASRAEMKEIAEKQGAKVLTSLSKSVDILVVGEAPGSKLKKAAVLGIKTVNEHEFLDLVSQRKTDQS